MKVAPKPCPRPPAECRRVLAWLRTHHVAPELTGQDRVALEGFAHALALYVMSVNQGPNCPGIVAMAAFVRATQPQFRGIARQVLLATLDRDEVEWIWSKIIAVVNTPGAA